jgi:hypothetical protein
MNRILFSTEKPKAETLWSELQYWQDRARRLLASGQRGEAHLVMKQELAPRMRQWSEVCGLSQALQKARLRHLLRSLPSDLAVATEETAKTTAPTNVPVSRDSFRPNPSGLHPASKLRIPFDDIPGIIDAIQADEESTIRRPRTGDRISA